MRYNKKIIKRRLESIPAEKRVWIYSAEIILEFLGHNFIPTKFFLTVNGSVEAKARPMKTEDFKESDSFKKHRISVNELYEQYLLFREKCDYTAEVETKFKFSIILNKLSYGQNGWEFIKARVSRQQIISFGPIQRRDELKAEVRKDYPINKTTLEGAQIPVSMKDLQTPDDEIDGIDKMILKTVNKGANVEYDKDWVEVILKDKIEQEWVETE